MPQPPIIVSEGHDLVILKTVADAEMFLEGWAVREGKQVAYDADGVRLQLEVRTWVPRNWLGRLLRIHRDSVAVTAPLNQEGDPASLSALLRNYLSAVGRGPLPGAEANLGELIAAAKRYAGR